MRTIRRWRWREQVRLALAQLDAAEVLWLPTVQMGSNYNNHQGAIQQVDGTVFNTSRAALGVGLGTGTVGSQSPQYPGLYANFALSDALFQPIAARQFARSQRLAAGAARNDVLLDVGLGYLDLLRAAQSVAINEDVLRTERRLDHITSAYARTGEGLLSDARRVQVELSIRQIDVQRSREDVQVASARLVELLRLDPRLTLMPIDPAAVPLTLVPEQTPLADLVSIGLMNRPELAENRALVAAAVEQLKREQYSPLLPRVVFGTSFGGFGGNIGGDISNFNNRFDGDLMAIWQVRNLGAGERTARGAARSEVRQADIRRIETMAQIAREVVQAMARVQSRRRQIELAREGLRAAIDSERLNFTRIEAAKGLPIEVLQSIQALAQTRQEYLRAVIDYNGAQFALHRALGRPIYMPATPPVGQETSRQAASSNRPPRLLGLARRSCPPLQEHLTRRAEAGNHVSVGCHYQPPRCRAP